MKMETQELFNQGKMYMAAENYALAEKCFADICKAEPENVDALCHLGNALTCLDKFDEALKTFRSALMHDKDNGRILYSIAGVYLLDNDIASAVRYYNRAEAAGYRSVEMYLILAGIFAESEDYAQAIRAFSNAIELRPLKAELYSKKASLQINYGDKEGALATLAELRELIPDAYESYKLAVQIHCMTESYDKALQEAEAGLARFPDDPMIKLLKLRVLAEAGRYEQTILLAEEILSMPDIAEAESKTIIYKASAHAMLSQTDKVIDTLRTYTSLDKDAQALYLLMNTYQMTGKFAGVKECAEKLEALDVDAPTMAAAIYYKANAIGRLEPGKAAAEFARIVPVLRKLSLKAPQNREIYVFRLLSHTELKEYDKAHALADYLCNAYPELPDGHLYRSHIFNRQGQREKAESERKAALAIAPGLKLQPLS